MAKQKPWTNALVYSTDPGFKKEEEIEETETLKPEAQQLKVSLDTKHRGGKVVTLISGFVGRTDDLEALGKMLKTKCGTGGTVKDGCIIIQGDYKAKVILWLQQLQYKVK
ncbi:MAG: translation initiation factor [Chitinophagaceae bacterium]|nr:translation initiation factor [Chitinophagaceae bacterium]